MAVVHFSHPLTAEQCARIEELVGTSIERVIDVRADFDEGQPFSEQVTALVAQVGLTPGKWQTLPPLLNLPAYRRPDGTLSDLRSAPTPIRRGRVGLRGRGAPTPPRGPKRGAAASLT